jgi:hypothetical protein
VKTRRHPLCAEWQSENHDQPALRRDLFINLTCLRRHLARHFANKGSHALIIPQVKAGSVSSLDRGKTLAGKRLRCRPGSARCALALHRALIRRLALFLQRAHDRESSSIVIPSRHDTRSPTGSRVISTMSLVTVPFAALEHAAPTKFQGRELVCRSAVCALVEMGDLP